MSYVHCPTCQRAYNLAAHAACPSCPVPATVVDPAEDIVAAAELLARALARATPTQRSAAAERMGGLLAPAPRPQAQLPPPPPAPRPLALAASLGLSIAEALVASAKRHVPRLTRRLPSLVSRVRALAA